MGKKFDGDMSTLNIIGISNVISKAKKGGGLDLEPRIQDEIHEQCESRARYLNGIFEGPVFDS